MKKREGWVLAFFLLSMAAAVFLEKYGYEMEVSQGAVSQGVVGRIENRSETLREAPQIALTFDDGPSWKYTPRLLDGLRERGVCVTFFLMGKNITGNEEIVKQMAEDGHLIGNHTYNHVQLNRISLNRAKEEIEKTSNEIYEITGTYPIYIRPPFGEWPRNLDLAVTMVPVMWDIDTLDWKCKNADTVVRTVEQNAEDGSIILMHDGYESTVEAVFRIVDEFQEKGYEFVTVEKLLIV